MSQAYHAVLLHAHLPFVRHADHDDFLEEDWLHEAVFECYLPLLKLLRGLKADGIPARMTLTMTPTLCEMLRDPLLQSRCSRYLERGREFCRRQETDGVHAFREIAGFHRERFAEAIEFYENGLHREVVGAFAQLQEEGVLEIITCAATHGFLPLMQQNPGAVRAQILLGRDSYRECFGREPLGIWLPECAYAPGIDSLLSEAEIRWFVLDSHGVLYGQPRPRFAMFSPYFTPAGPAVFGRDRDSSRQVWSSREGYPGDPAYRDFYRDLGKEVSDEEFAEVYGAAFPRRFTGLKPCRITGAGQEKQPYVRSWAMAAAESHASDFLHNRIRQFEDLREKLPVDPILVSPFDAELFGHWWYEGPEFLNLYLRKAACDQSVFQLVTPSDYLANHPTQQILSPATSSWGNHGYWDVWLNETNSWIYPHLHAAAKTMCSLAAEWKAGRPSSWQERCLAQLARELLLAQSSDWAFLMKTGTAREYAERRTKDHLRRFQELHAVFLSGDEPCEPLNSLESLDNLFARLSWRYFA